MIMRIAVLTTPWPPQPRKRLLPALLWICVLLGTLTDRIAWGHEVRPAYVEITPAAYGWRVLWRQPVVGDIAVALRPELSGGALETPPVKRIRTSSYLLKEWQVPTASGSLHGQRLTIAGLEHTITDTLVQVRLNDGEEFTRLLTPDSPSMVLSTDEPGTPVMAAYLLLGLEHILLGADHLLFIFGLLLLVRARAMLWWTITAFTVAHSIALGLAALGMVRVPVALVEATIALSILFVAVEIINLWRGQPGLSSQCPWAVAWAFGLLHGLGFATALGEIGLPRDAMVPALLLFNVGVELGQVMFVAAVLALGGGLRRQDALRWVKARWVAPYAIGGLAGYWFIERSLVVFMA